jgi:RNA polymerase sigma factor (sigma-70 family)
MSEQEKSTTGDLVQRAACELAHEVAAGRLAARGLSDLAAANDRAQFAAYFRSLLDYPSPCPSRMASFPPLDVYMREIHSPSLTAVAVRSLAEMVKRGDILAREQLVRANLQLVFKVASDYGGTCLTLPELIDAGNIGIVRRVDEHRTGRQHTKFLESMRKRGLSPSSLERFAEKRFEYPEIWIRRWIQWAIKDAIGPVLDTLSYREREIIKLRYGLDSGYTYTLEEVGRVFQMTQDRVAQVVANLRAKLAEPEQVARRRCDAARDLEVNGKYADAIAEYSAVIRLLPSFVDGYLYLSWMLATCPDQRLRNGMRAIEMATNACEISGWNDERNLRCLAAAYAENGEFEKAQRFQKKAIENTKDEEDIAECQRVLDLYKRKMPHSATC